VEINTNNSISSVARDIFSKIWSSWILYGCVIYHSTRQFSYSQNNLVVKRKYGAVFLKSRSKAKNIFFYHISTGIPFSLKKDDKLHIWFSLFNFLSKTSDVIKNLWPWFLNNCTIFSFDDQIILKVRAVPSRMIYDTAV
jgi:hypothetical protein